MSTDRSHVKVVKKTARLSVFGCWPAEAALCMSQWATSTALVIGSALMRRRKMKWVCYYALSI